MVDSLFKNGHFSKKTARINVLSGWVHYDTGDWHYDFALVLCAHISVLPGVLVGAFIGTHMNDYYSTEM